MHKPYINSMIYLRIIEPLLRINYLGLDGQGRALDMTGKRRIALAVEIDEPHPHHQDIFLGVQLFAQEHAGWELIIDEHPCSPRAEHSAAPVRYDGIIARTSPAMLKRARDQGVPLVNVHYLTHRPGLASVLSDPVQIGRVAAEHLLGIGMPRLSFITDKHQKHMLDASKAFARRAKEEGVPCSLTYFNEQPYGDEKAWLEMESSLLRFIETMKPPIGVNVSTAPLARVFLQHAQARGWRVPRDVAVLCNRDLRAIVEISPKISSIEVNNTQIGYAAAQLLDELIDGKPIPHDPIFIAPGEITARESTDFRLVDDDLVARALNYISENLQAPLRVHRIADHLDVSTRLLQKRFAQHLGTGVSEEVRRLRLEKAKRLLTDPGRLIRSIPKQIGFRSANVLNINFMRELGMTPTEYRKKILDEKPYRNQRASTPHDR